MFSYQKRLQYPINIKKKDLRMAKYLVTQYGGSNGELAAALRYLNQRMSMPDEKGKALLNDIGTEESVHLRLTYKKASLRAISIVRFLFIL